MYRNTDGVEPVEMKLWDMRVRRVLYFYLFIHFSGAGSMARPNPGVGEGGADM